MSATDRARKASEALEKRRSIAMEEGMRRTLQDPDGRALIMWLVDTSLRAEGEGSAQLRAFGRDIMLSAQLASWEGVQIMREEWEKPRGTRAEAEDEEGEE